MALSGNKGKGSTFGANQAKDIIKQILKYLERIFKWFEAHYEGV